MFAVSAFASPHGKKKSEITYIGNYQAPSFENAISFSAVVSQILELGYDQPGYLEVVPTKREAIHVEFGIVRNKSPGNSNLL